MNREYAPGEYVPFVGTVLADPDPADYECPGCGHDVCGCYTRYGYRPVM